VAESPEWGRVNVVPLDDRVAALEEAVFGSTAETPVPGQMWKRGIAPGYAWKVCSISGGMVHLELYREHFDGVTATLQNPRRELADAYMDWPVDRWRRLVESERLTLR
jgi:hypothetical protein